MFSDAQKLAYVAQSPVLCAAHDRAGWVGLFASDGQVNDPIGSKPHEGREAIERFYDTFIAPNQLSFDVEHDIVDGMSVMRDLTLTSTMSTGLTIPVPMHLRYDLVEESGALKIHRLYAHWELPVLLAAQMGTSKGWITSMKLTPALLKHQGFSGLMGFMRGLRGNGRAGKPVAEAFLAAASRGDVTAALSSCHPERSEGSLKAVITRLKDSTARKFLASGNWVTATVEWGASRRGVVRLHFAESANRISGTELHA
jgi:hypothetical protein